LPNHHLFDVREGTVDDGHGRRLRYRRLGERSRPVVCALGGISADRFVDDWWAGLVGPGRPLDPMRHCIVSMDWLASGPGKRRVPTTGDQAAMLCRVLDAERLARADVLVAASYGAMVALATAAAHPERAGRVVAIAGAHRSTPAAAARRLIQRRIIHAAQRTGAGPRGVALARALALTTYRPDALLNRRFGAEDPASMLSALADYFDAVGERFAASFDAGRYLALSESLDLHCIDPASLRCEIELVGTATDRLVPMAQLRELAAAAGSRVRVHEIGSPFGHDAFLKSTEDIGPIVAASIARAGEVGRAK
jgi:homoserine O-acetyltransferase